jgi:hypothetical protein
VPTVLKSGSLKLLETSGPDKACNGIVLPSTLTLRKEKLQIPIVQPNVIFPVQLTRFLSKNLKIKIYRTVVLYGCATWSLTLREESRLRVFENRVLGEYLCLRGTRGVVRRMRWAGHVGRMGYVRGVYRDLVEKPEGKRPLGRIRRRWEDNNNMNF